MSVRIFGSMRDEVVHQVEPHPDDHEENDEPDERHGVPSFSSGSGGGDGVVGASSPGPGATP